MSISNSKFYLYPLEGCGPFRLLFKSDASLAEALFFMLFPFKSTESRICAVVLAAATPSMLSPRLFLASSSFLFTPENSSPPNRSRLFVLLTKWFFEADDDDDDKVSTELGREEAGGGGIMCC